MSKLILFILPFLILFFNCDGRDRVYKVNVEILRDSNLLESFSKQTKNIPNEPVEIFTDTILNNGFQVKIKYLSIENDLVYKKTQPKNDSLININYKNFEAKFQVLKDGDIIAVQTLNKALFSKFNNSPFWDDAIMQFIWLDYSNSMKDYIKLSTSFCIPDTESCKDFTIKINSYGSIDIKEINLVSQVL